MSFALTKLNFAFGYSGDHLTLVIVISGSILHEQKNTTRIRPIILGSMFLVI